MNYNTNIEICVHLSISIRSDYLGQLIATPKNLAKNVKATKDNKSRGVERNPPKLPMETVKQISIPHASVQLVIKSGSCSF